MKNINKLNELVIEKWETQYTETAFIKNVEILNKEPLRGIKNTSLSIIHPLTIICGANGVGKSTFLALALLSVHGDGTNRFDRYFKSKSGETFNEGINIQWEYTNGHSFGFEKKASRWMRYTNRSTPRRPVVDAIFVGISRVLPAFEKKSYEKYPFNKSTKVDSKINSKINENLNYILKSTSYSTEQHSYENSTGQHKLNVFNEQYSSFNAGTGEDALTHILFEIHSAPCNSIICIEEVEIGIHPSCLERLIHVLLQTILEKNIQIILTTHSPYILKAAPSESLVLGEKYNGIVSFTSKPNIDYAINILSGSKNYTLYILCEDKVAASLILSLLSPKLRMLVCVKFYGADNQLIVAAKALQTANSHKVLIVWDGDAKDKLFNQAKSEQIEYCQLPGGAPPEKYILEKLNTEEGKQFLVDQILDNSAIESTLADIQRNDIHSIFYIIAEKSGLNQEVITNSIIRFIVEKYADEFNDLKENITNLVNR